jgi:hypothetical protein
VSAPVNTVKAPAGYGIHRKRFHSNGPDAGMQSFFLIGSGISLRSLPFFHAAHRIGDSDAEHFFRNGSAMGDLKKVVGKEESIVLQRINKQRINKQIKWDCRIPFTPI